METNNIDQIIKQKLANRTFQPATSAWERLSVSLDEQPKKKNKKLFITIGFAASILLCITLGIAFFLNTDNPKIPEQIIVSQPIDTINIQNNIEKHFKQIPVENAIVKESTSEDNKVKNKMISQKSSKKIIKSRSENLLSKNEMIVIDKKELEKDNQVSENTINYKEKLQKIENSKSAITINSNDLLYAVTHNPQEVQTYYAKYQKDRNEVLKIIKNELKATHIKMNPSTILADVERTITEEEFKNDFMNLIKKKVVDIAQAIATRNN